MDFGISRLITAGPRTSTAIIGTPAYMAPELITTGTCSYPADVYAAGITLYEMLAGRTPFEGEGTDFTVASRHTDARPPRIDVPESVWNLLDSMLAKNPEKRPSAKAAIAKLADLGGILESLLPLEPTAAPASYEATGGHETIIRPRREADDSEPAAAPAAPALAADFDVPSLGEGEHATVMREVDRPERVVPAPRDDASQADGFLATTWGKAVAGLGALAVVAGIAAAVIYFKPFSATKAPAEPLSASQQDSALPSGLAISREAEWDPQTQEATITWTYESQKAPISGPFFEIVQSEEEGVCLALDWPHGEQERNASAATFISEDCAWALDPGASIEPGSPVTVTAKATLAFPADALGADKNPLQDWLDANAKATTAALANQQVHSTAYPAQRLQGIELSAPSRVPSGDVVPLDLVPVWPSGPDTPANALYHSPQTGSPTDMLLAVSGGDQPVKFADECGGALDVSRDGLTVTAPRPAMDCRVSAKVGNFDDIISNGFDVVGHDS